VAETTEVRLDVVSPDDIRFLQAESVGLALARETGPVLADLIADFGTFEMAAVQSAVSFTMVDPVVVGYLAEYGAVTVHGINQTTRAELARTLAEGVLAGEGSGALALRVRDVFQRASAARSAAIARTEVNGAANFSRTLAHQKSGTVKKRRWLSTRDLRTRSHHLKLHGQVRGLKEPFVIPGTSRRALYPGGFGVASEDVNCRCTTLPIVNPVSDAIEDGLSAADKETVRAYELRVLRWEGAFTEALRRAFATQEAAVLAALRRIRA